MTAAITLAGPDHLQALLGLMSRYHDEQGITLDDDHRLKAVAPLLTGSPLGAAWLIGPTRAPLGYVLVTFGWSVASGGMIGWIDEVYVRPSVRNRGIGTEVVHAVAVSLGKSEMNELHVRLAPQDDAIARFYARAGFTNETQMRMMTDKL